MGPGTTETKSESEHVLIQPSQEASISSDDSRSPSPKKTLLHRDEQPPPANGEKGAGQDEHEPLRSPSEDEDEQLLSMDESLDSDQNIPTHGWLGNEDQMADLILVLRWAQAYRVSIEGAGRMLKMQPEIVNRAAAVHAQSTSGSDPNARARVVFRPPRPVIRHWVRLGPL